MLKSFSHFAFVTLLFLSVFFGIVAHGCSVTETGNPSVKPNLLIAGYTSSNTTVSIGGDAPINITSAWITLEKIEFVSAATCTEEQEDSVQIRGPFTLNLIANDLQLPIDGAQMSFCKVVVPIKKAETPLPSGTPGFVANHSIAITGEYQGIPFELTTATELEAEIESEQQSFSLDAAQQQLLLAFDLAAWFSGLDLAQATVSGDKIIIDETNNTPLYEQFNMQIERALELLKDEDGDGQVDDDETDPIAGDQEPELAEDDGDDSPENPS